MEFRIEVVFETPVIFLAPPHNKRGPVRLIFLLVTEFFYEGPAAPELSRKPTNGKANWDTAPETVPKLQSSLGYF
jgi:hypothetical protein